MFRCSGCIEVFLVAYTRLNLNLENFAETQPNRQERCMSIVHSIYITLFVRPMRLSHKTTEALTDSSASKTFHE
jgi:hypothetical protein